MNDRKLEEQDITIVRRKDLEEPTDDVVDEVQREDYNYDYNNAIATLTFMKQSLAVPKLKISVLDRIFGLSQDKMKAQLDATLKYMDVKAGIDSALEMIIGSETSVDESVKLFILSLIDTIQDLTMNAKCASCQGPTTACVSCDENTREGIYTDLNTRAVEFGLHPNDVIMNLDDILHTRRNA